MFRRLSSMGVRGVGITGIEIVRVWRFQALNWVAVKELKLSYHNGYIW